MQLALECPIYTLERYQPFADFDFILTHLMSNKEYREYYEKSSRFKILDNSTNELGTPCSINDILEAAYLVKPDYICPPDYLGDPNSTLRALTEAENLISRKFHLLPIIQAERNNYTSLVDFAGELVDRGYDRVAIPYDILNTRDSTLETMAGTRLRVALYLSRDFRWIHLLGCTSPEELYQYKQVPNVRSIDTGSPLTNGLSGFRYGKDTLLTKDVMLDFASVDLTPMKDRNVLHNISYLRQIINKEDKWLTKI